MTKPDQLRLAAEITEKNTPWQSRANASYDWGLPISDDFPALIACLRQGVEIRIKPEPALVPLGPEDVPPGSAIRCVPPNKYVPWWMITKPTYEGIEVDGKIMTYSSLMPQRGIESSFEIKRPGQDWMSCSKPA